MFRTESVEAFELRLFVTMTAWPTRLMRVHWKLFAASSESVIFQLFWRIDEKPSCLQSQWLMKPALGQSKEEEDWQDQTTHYLPPSLGGNWGKKMCSTNAEAKKTTFGCQWFYKLIIPTLSWFFINWKLSKENHFRFWTPLQQKEQLCHHQLQHCKVRRED